MRLTLQTVYEVIPNADPCDPQRGWERHRPLPSRTLLGFTHAHHSEGAFEDKRLVCLVRDPRDILVSLYFHKSRHHSDHPGSISSFIRSRWGAHALIDYLESWAPVVQAGAAFSVTYEQLRARTSETVLHVANYLDLGLAATDIGVGVAASTFGRMQSMELAHGIAGHAYDRTDPEALRVRRGVVGGYVDYLTVGDSEYVLDALRSTSPAARTMLRSIPSLTEVV